jgi:hypothetical protein
MGRDRRLGLTMRGGHAAKIGCKVLAALVAHITRIGRGVPAVLAAHARKIGRGVLGMHPRLATRTRAKVRGVLASRKVLARRRATVLHRLRERLARMTHLTCCLHLDILRGSTRRHLNRRC